jgi:cation diffusion facilitator family transporter
MAESKTAVVAALVGNGALAVLKGTSAAFTGSAAMLAETFHSIADTANEALLLLGMRLATRPADDDHPFGHGKAVYFWAFVVSIMLFTLGGAWSIWEALRHYLHPVSKQATLWAYGVLAAAFVFESISFGVALHSLNAVRGSRPILDYWQDSRDPALLTVLLEDSAALVALPIAASGLWLTSYTGNGVWDAAASAVIGVLLLSVAVVLAIENHSLLIGESAPTTHRASDSRRGRWRARCDRYPELAHDAPRAEPDPDRARHSLRRGPRRSSYRGRGSTPGASRDRRPSRDDRCSIDRYRARRRPAGSRRRSSYQVSVTRDEPLSDLGGRSAAPTPAITVLQDLCRGADRRVGRPFHAEGTGPLIHQIVVGGGDRPSRLFVADHCVGSALCQLGLRGEALFECQRFDGSLRSR